MYWIYLNVFVIYAFLAGAKSGFTKLKSQIPDLIFKIPDQNNQISKNVVWMLILAIFWGR